MCKHVVTPLHTNVETNAETGKRYLNNNNNNSGLFKQCFHAMWLLVCYKYKLIFKRHLQEPGKPTRTLTMLILMNLTSCKIINFLNLSILAKTFFFLPYLICCNIWLKIQLASKVLIVGKTRGDRLYLRLKSRC